MGRTASPFAAAVAATGNRLRATSNGLTAAFWRQNDE